MKKIKLIIINLVASTILFGANIEDNTSVNNTYGDLSDFNVLFNSSDNMIGHYGAYSSDAFSNAIYSTDNASILGNNNLVIDSSASHVNGNNNVAIKAEGVSDESVAIGHMSASHNYSVAIGSTSRAVDSVAIGHLSTAFFNSVAIGEMSNATGFNSVALGNMSEALGSNSVAIGDGSFTDQDWTFSIGSAGFERRLINVAAPISGTDAVNLQYLQDNFYTKTEVDALNVGTTDLTAIETDIATLDATVTTLDTAVTTLDTAVATNTTDIATLDATVTDIQTVTSALRNDADSTSLTRVSSVTGNEHGIYVGDTETKITGGTTSTQMILEDDKISISHVSTGDPVIFTGVADGVDDYDAVNRSQLDEFYDNSTSYTDQRIEEIDSKINVLEHNLRKEIERSAATAIALSTPLYFNNGDNFAMSIGYGSYESEQAVAVNMGYRKKSHTVTVGTSLNRSQKVLKAGYSFSF